MDIILAIFLLIIVFILGHYEFYFLSAIVGLVFVAGPTTAGWSIN